MIGLIVARSANNVIGKDGKIPWFIEGEQKQFKELTTGNAIIMGRKTYMEIGRPLPNRLNIIVSGSICNEMEAILKYSNVIVVRSLKKAIEAAEDMDVYIAGGYGLYKEGVKFVDRMYITEVDAEIEGGDTFFPEFDAGEFECEEESWQGEDIKFRRTIYKRKKKNLYIRWACAQETDTPYI